MIGKIKGIIGHIGPSYVDKGGQFHQGCQLIDVIDQIGSLPEGVTEIEIPVNSPGGYADIGDDIYNYLVSLKKNGKTVTTIQTGLVGSIATKIFLAGDRRIVDDRYEFWIHNPFIENVSGDQDELRAMAESLANTEKDLRKFYGEFTNITDEGLDGLMKIETGLTADQCIKFKFGTEKKTVPAFNSIKMATKPVKVQPKKDEKSFMEHVKAFFAPEEVKKKGVAPKAQIPGNDVQNVVVTLADGAGSFWIEAEALAEGVPCFMLDAEGQPTAEPVPDGEYKLEDGSMVSVAGGMVSAITQAGSGEGDGGLEDMISKAEAEAMVTAAVEKALADSKAQLEGLQNDIKNFKQNVKLGIQPRKASLQTPAQEKIVNKTIAQIQIEREAERKKLNSKVR